jgi:hypothetical protein
VEASLIAELIRRDLPYYDPTISREVFQAVNQFAGVDQPPAYEEVVLEA